MQTRSERRQISLDWPSAWNHPAALMGWVFPLDPQSAAKRHLPPPLPHHYHFTSPFKASLSAPLQTNDPQKNNTA